MILFLHRHPHPLKQIGREEADEKLLRRDLPIRCRRNDLNVERNFYTWFVSFEEESRLISGKIDFVTLSKTIGFFVMGTSAAGRM